MKTVKIAHATNTQLDWLVAKLVAAATPVISGGRIYRPAPQGSGMGYLMPECRYTTDAAQAWPLIEREGINVSRYRSKPLWSAQPFMADGDLLRHTGSTSLVAAMRVYVASRLGHTAEVPKELD